MDHLTPCVSQQSTETFPSDLVHMTVKEEHDVQYM